VRFKETEVRGWSHEAIPPRVSLSLLQWETLEVLLNRNRQLLASEWSVKMLLGTQDSRFSARRFTRFCNQEEWDSPRRSYVLDRLQELLYIQFLAFSVADDKIGLVLLGGFECLLFIRGVHDLVSIADQRLSHRRNGQEVIVDNQNLFWRWVSHSNQDLLFEFVLCTTYINVKTCSQSS
jgi:hypothetical protein